jgi:hypothetical protein
LDFGCGGGFVGVIKWVSRRERGWNCGGFRLWLWLCWRGCGDGDVAADDALEAYAVVILARAI